ncbi:helix-turn-helix domain-containing protein [Clostridioides difficile]|nr:helix-turn-helix domain-containing protein [Clostridioides difficile]HBH3439849.1 helix-turn-helix transcriptional regulator [Clostridioides difficile]
MKFSDLVNSKRELLNIKLKELEAETGITASYISRIEKGQVNGVSGDNVFKLAKALKISIDEIAEAFDVELIKNNENNIMNTLKDKDDYILVNQGIESILDIANNEKDYYDSLKRLLKIVEMLRKNKIMIVGIVNDGNADYVVEIKYNDKVIVEFVKDTLRRRLGANIIVLEGSCINYDNIITYELLDFIEDFIEDEFDKEEILNYIKKIKY